MSEFRRQNGQTAAAPSAGVTMISLNSLILHRSRVREGGVVSIGDAEQETSEWSIESLYVQCAGVVNLFIPDQGGVATSQLHIMWVAVVRF